MGAYPLYNSMDLVTKSLYISRNMVVKKHRQCRESKARGKKPMDKEIPPKTNDIVAVLAYPCYVSGNSGLD